MWKRILLWGSVIVMCVILYVVATSLWMASQMM